MKPNELCLSIAQQDELVGSQTMSTTLEQVILGVIPGKLFCSRLVDPSLIRIVQTPVPRWHSILARN